MQPQGGPPGGPPGAQNPFAYNVNTTYIPHDEVVPAVPQAGPSQGAWGPPPTGPAPPFGARPMPQPALQPPPGHMSLQFTDTTAPQYVTGNISKQEERQGLVNPGPRSDDPASSQQPFGAAPSGSGPSAAADGTAKKDDHTKYPFYNVRRYREFFDVDTTDVLWRVGNSLIGVFRPNFMEVTMKSPDLYGPFWVATTLVFFTAVAGNFGNYIDWRMTRPSPPPPSPPNSTLSPPPAAHTKGLENQWFTDYTKLGTSAAIFYGYVFIVGLCLFFCVKWFKGELRIVNVLCIYGYCLSIYIPVSIACIVPIDWLRWTLVMVATALSAGFLFMNFRATIYSAAPARATIIMLLMVVIHIGLGIGLKLYFFNYN